MPNPSEKVSVVVPAYNAQKTLRKTLEALAHQTFGGPRETIVVDDGSTDDTPAIIKDFPDVIAIRQANAGPASARNLGFRASSGAYVLFTDADCVPEPEWVARIVAAFTRPEIGAVAGTYGIENPQSLLARCIHREIVFRHKFLMSEHVRAFGSYNCGVRRPIFEAAGGFHTAYRFASGEDNDLSYKIFAAGHKIFFERGAIVRHHFPEDLRRYYREQFRHGFWRVRMYLDHPAMMSGDDYTFWKDILEPPLVLGIVACSVLWPFVPLLWGVFGLGLLTVLISIEIFYGLRTQHHLAEGLFFAHVTFVRAFARTAGFLLGLTHFLARNPFKKTQ